MRVPLSQFTLIGIVIGAAAIAGGLIVFWALDWPVVPFPSNRRAAAVGRVVDRSPSPDGFGNSDGNVSTSVERSDTQPAGDPVGDLEITVLDLLGRTIDGAQITLVRQNGKDRGETSRQRLVQRSGQKLEIKGIAFGRLLWSASAPGHSDSEGQFDFRPDNATLSIFLKPLTPPLRGVVLDSVGDPVAGIEVAAALRSDDHEIGRVSTDVDGRFIILGTPTEGSAAVYVVTGGRCKPVYVNLPSDEDIVLHVELDGIITGRVLDGAIPADLTNGHFNLSTEPPSNNNDNLRSISTPGGGVFRLQVRPGLYQLNVETPMGCVWRSEIAVAPGQTTDLGDLLLEAEGAGLELKVIRGEPPTPVGGCAISLTQCHPPGQPQTGDRRVVQGKTDQNGRFYASALPAGMYNLKVFKDTYAERFVEFTDNEHKVLELGLPSFGILEGRVVAGPEFQPVAGARITARQQVAMGAVDDDPPLFTRQMNLDGAGPPDSGDSGRPPSSISVITTDQDGRFTLTRVLPDLPLELIVEAGDWAARTISLVLKNEREWIDVVLNKPGCSLRGRVVNQAGVGVGAEVVYESVEARLHVVAGADGRFAFDNMIPDVPFTLQAHHGDVKSRTMYFEDVPEEDVTLTLIESDTLLLKLANADGSPVQGLVKVVRSGDDSHVIETLDVMNGRAAWKRFDMWGIPLEFRQDRSAGRRTFFKPEMPDGTPEVVILQPIGRLDVMVQNSLGEPLRGAHVTISEEEAKPAVVTDQLTTGRSGRVIFDVYPGKYRISAVYGNHAPSQATATVVSGESAQVVIQIAEGSQLDIQVVRAESNAPLKGVTGLLMTDQRLVVGGVASDEGGMIRVMGLPPGSYTLALDLSPGTTLEQGGLLMPEGPEIRKTYIVQVPRLIPVTFRFLDGREPWREGQVQLTPRHPGDILAPHQTVLIGGRCNTRGEIVLSIPPTSYNLYFQPVQFSTELTITDNDINRVLEFNLAVCRVKVKVFDVETQRPISGAPATLLKIEDTVQALDSRRSDDYGAALFQFSGDGTYRVVIEGMMDYKRWESGNFTLTSDHPEEEIDAFLEKHKRPKGQLTLQMIDEQTQRPVDEMVENFLIWDMVLGGWGGEAEKFSLPGKGMVVFEGFSPGQFWAQAFTPDYVSEKKTFLMPEDQGLLLTLRSFRKASVRVLVENLPRDFDTRTAFELTLYDPVNRSIKRNALWARVGRPVGPFQPGFYAYQFELPNIGSFDGMIELLAGETTDIKIVLPPPPGDIIPEDSQ